MCCLYSSHYTSSNDSLAFAIFSTLQQKLELLIVHPSVHIKHWQRGWNGLELTAGCACVTVGSEIKGETIEEKGKMGKTGKRGREAGEKRK